MLVSRGHPPLKSLVIMLIFNSFVTVWDKRLIFSIDSVWICAVLDIMEKLCIVCFTISYNMCLYNFFLPQVPSARPCGLDLHHSN